MKIIEFLLSLFGRRTTVLLPPIEKPAVVPETPVEPPAPVKEKTEVDTRSFRRFRLTYYYVADQSRFTGSASVPVLDVDGRELCRVEPGFFGDMSLQGTGKMRDGRLLNVSSKFVPVRHEDYAAVLERHRKYLSKRPCGYSGIVVRDDRVVQAMAYHLVQDVGVGFGTLRGKPHVPFRTLAADIGRLRRHEPRWLGKGGVCPLFTKVFIKQMVGKRCPNPDGTWFIHDGWFEVIDTGGGIFGKHFDVFVGTPNMVRNVSIPGTADVWYDTIEERVPPDEEYSYGLYDK